MFDIVLEVTFLKCFLFVNYPNNCFSFLKFIFYISISKQSKNTKKLFKKNKFEILQRHFTTVKIKYKD